MSLGRANSAGKTQHTDQLFCMFAIHVTPTCHPSPVRSPPVQEYSTPAAFEIPATAALSDAVTTHAAESPDRVALSRRSGDAWVPVTSREFAEQVTALARGMIAAGVGPGDRVGILSKTRYEWTLADYAIWTAGGVGVPIYETSSAEQAQWILADSGAVAVVVETAEHAATVASVRDQVPGLKEVWQIEAGDLEAVAARAGIGR